MVGKPITAGAHRAFMHPSYMALQTLATSVRKEDLVSARHTLVALFNYLSTAALIDDRDVEQVQEGLQAIFVMDARFERTGVVRPSGEELQVLRAAVAWCDRTLPYLRTDLLAEARTKVNAALREMKGEACTPI